MAHNKQNKTFLNFNKLIFIIKLDSILAGWLIYLFVYLYCSRTNDRQMRAKIQG